jgi:hypothetical protein
MCRASSTGTANPGSIFAAVASNRCPCRGSRGRRSSWRRTAHEIASITGHASISEVQRYTSAANRKLLAQSAMKKLIEGGS